MDTTLLPYVGLSTIKFGYSLGRVEAILGSPSDTTKELYSDDASVDMILAYHALGLDLTFSSDDDFRLGTITVYAKEFLIFQTGFIGLSESDFLQKSTPLFDDLELDDSFETEESREYISNKNGISLWVEHGVVESISLYPKYAKDGETPLWPLD